MHGFTITVCDDAYDCLGICCDDCEPTAVQISGMMYCNQMCWLILTQLLESA